MLIQGALRTKKTPKRAKYKEGVTYIHVQQLSVTVSVLPAAQQTSYSTPQSAELSQFEVETLQSHLAPHTHKHSHLEAARRTRGLIWRPADQPYWKGSAIRRLVQEHKQPFCHKLAFLTFVPHLSSCWVDTFSPEGGVAETWTVTWRQRWAQKQN